MVMEHIVLDILAVILLTREVAAAIVRHETVFKMKPQIPVLQLMQKHPRHMQQSFRACQPRRSKHLSHRDIDIRHTIFKIGLGLGIVQLVKLYLYIRLVSVLSFDQHGRALVQHIYDLLLHIPVKHVIQRIDTHHVIKNFLILLPDLRHGKGNDRKAALLPPNILVLDIGNLSRIGYRKLLLFFAQTACRLLVFRHKGDLPEALHHCRSAVKGRQLLMPFEDIVHGFCSSLRQRPVQKERHIFLMIIVILLIGIRTAITVFVHTPALKDICSCPAEGRL